MADDSRTRGERAADAVSRGLGSWRFIIWQTGVVAAWITLNTLALTHSIRWDAYPFILLNLAFSTQAAYAAPILQLASNRSARAREAVEDKQAATHLATMEAIHALVEAVRADMASRDEELDKQLEALNEHFDGVGHA